MENFNTIKDVAYFFFACTLFYAIIVAVFAMSDNLNAKTTLYKDEVELLETKKENAKKESELLELETAYKKIELEIAYKKNN